MLTSCPNGQTCVSWRQEHYDGHRLCTGAGVTGPLVPVSGGYWGPSLCCLEVALWHTSVLANTGHGSGTQGLEDN